MCFSLRRSIFKIQGAIWKDDAKIASFLKIKLSDNIILMLFTVDSSASHVDNSKRTPFGKSPPAPHAVKRAVVKESGNNTKSPFRRYHQTWSFNACFQQPEKFIQVTRGSGKHVGGIFIFKFEKCFANVVGYGSVALSQGFQMFLYAVNVGWVIF